MTRIIKFVDASGGTEGSDEDLTYKLIITADAFGEHIASVNDLSGNDPLSVFRAKSAEDAVSQARDVLQERHPGLEALISHR